MMCLSDRGAVVAAWNRRALPLTEQERLALDNAEKSYCGARDQDDVWEIPRPKASAEHPTMKPVELVARALINSSSKGDIVLDPFGGAGSLILAAEQLGRRGRSIELDPGYCDVIVKRWETMTGRKALRAGGVIKSKGA